jgi:GMP synthase (glutamine-hydrolysing)
MSVDERPTLLAIQHVPWETPHRILDACGGLAVHTVKPLAGHSLPDHAEIAGAVVLGGTMNVDDIDRFPALAAEREWLAEAVRRQMPVLGGLAPRTEVLHWHGDVFDLPDGAQHLASSELTENQAFRVGNAWGVLFHPEADLALVEAWLRVPEMIDEAVAALGNEGVSALPGHAEELEGELVRGSTPGFEAFAALVAAAGSG